MSGQHGTKRRQPISRLGPSAMSTADCPDVSAGSDSQGVGFLLANFVKATLHAFTATLTVENERLEHDVPVNQINVTHRVRSEEPRNDEERLEAVKRFSRAVLLAGAPLPDAEDSR